MYVQKMFCLNIHANFDTVIVEVLMFPFVSIGDGEVFSQHCHVKTHIRSKREAIGHGVRKSVSGKAR